MEEEYLKKIEELNLENIELKQSKEYRTGKDIAKFKNMIKNFQIATLITKKINRTKKNIP